MSKRPVPQPAAEVASKLARDLEEWALVREKVLTRLDVRSARKGRLLAASLRSATASGAPLDALIREGQALLLRTAAPDDEAPQAAHTAKAPGPVPGSGVKQRRDTVPQPHAPRLNVLVVEDDAVVRTLMVRRLSAIAQVDSVGSVADARALLARDAYDVVVCDLQLGRDSGADLLAEVAREQPLTRRILFTATPDALDQSLRNVCHELLEKSNGVSQLIEAVSPPLFTDDAPTPDHSKREPPMSGEHPAEDDLPASKPAAKPWR